MDHPSARSEHHHVEGGKGRASCSDLARTIILLFGKLELVEHHIDIPLLRQSINKDFVVAFKVRGFHDGVANAVLECLSPLFGTRFVFSGRHKLDGVRDFVKAWSDGLVWQ
jgi:hypothetical protein